MTLNRTSVKSVAERDIANFLFLNRVEFRYEFPARWADQSPDYRQWTPDFFLPYYNLWIEHWAVDKLGKVPPWFSEKYLEDMEWKRSQFRKHHQTLIETYSYQHSEHTLVSELRRNLENRHVTFMEPDFPKLVSCL